MGPEYQTGQPVGGIFWLMLESLRVSFIVLVEIGIRWFPWIVVARWMFLSGQINQRFVGLVRQIFSLLAKQINVLVLVLLWPFPLVR